MNLIHERKRVVIARILVETMRVYTRAYFKNENIGAHAVDILIGIAIVIGHSEGRPMTASDISAYIGIPRPTVVRHMKLAVKKGFAVPVKEGKRQPFYLLRGNEPMVVSEIVKLFDRYSKLCDQLTKLDDKTFATQLRSG